MQTRGEPQDHRGHQGPETKSHHRSDARHHCHAGSFIPGTWVKEESSARPHKQTQRHPLVRKTYDNLFWLFSAPHGTRRPHRIRLLGGGFRPIERRRLSLLTAEEPVRRRERRFVPVSVRWDPRPGCYPALFRMPRRSFRHVVATGDAMLFSRTTRSYDSLTRPSNIDDVMPMSS